MKKNEGYQYYVENLGDGEPTVFLPAAGFAGIEGLNIAENLQDKFQIHMLDLPGFGRGSGIKETCRSIEMANWLKGYLEQEGLNKVNLIGHSLGGAVAMTFAKHYPDRVNKLVLLDQGHKPFPRIPMAEFGIFAYSFPLLNVLVRLFGMRFLKRLEPLFTGNEEPGEEDFDESVRRFCEKVSVEETEYVRQAMKGPGSFSVEGLNLMFGFYNLNLPKLLDQISVPTLLVYGTFENIENKEMTKTAKSIKKLQLKNVPIQIQAVAGGHYVHWSNQNVLKDIKKFLSGEKSYLMM